jgi:hypothetical protein
MTASRLTLAGFALCLALAPRSAAAAKADDYFWSGALEPGGTVTILGINGAIHAEPAKGNTLEVRAVRSSRHHDPSVVKIEMHQEGGRITFCALYPAPKNSPPNTCGDADHTRSHTDSDDLTVDFRVLVPAGVTLEARTVNGAISATNLAGPVDAKTVNGGIEVSTTSWAEAATVNGDVDVAMAGKGWPDGLDFRTVNGSITLHMGGAVNAEVKAETMNGDIATDFPLTMLGSMKKNKLHATIGAGGPELALATLNGSIELRKAP